MLNMSKLSNLDRAIYAQREWENRGRPEKAGDIQRLINAGEEVPESLLHTSKVKPQANADAAESYSPPPRKGKGSGKEAWREFAGQVTDVEVDVLEAMDRDDVIELLVSRGVIEKES